MDLLGIRSLPFHARRNYFWEFRHLIPWSVLAGLVEGQFASVVVSKSFHGSERMIAIATATPIAALMFSLVWGMLCVGRPKVRLAMLFAGGTALCAGVVGAIPTSPAGAIWFVTQMAAAQVLLAGVVTVRSAIWKSNYPRSARGQITARLQGVRFVVTVVTVLIAAVMCDRDPQSYRYVFPAAAVVGAIGIFLLSGLHIRGERNELRRPGVASPDNGVRTVPIQPFSVTALMSPGHVFGQMTGVLRRDRRFARYCVAQLLTGIANLMTISIIVTVITRDLPTGDASGFWISTALIVALPRLAMLGSLRRWGRLFDRIGVLRFRVINIFCWMMALVFGLAATLTTMHAQSAGSGMFLLAVALFVVRALFNGIGLGGGALAWNLGHLHFARPDQAEIYMGIHVSLTGIRGLVAPIGGMWLWRMIGWPVWLIAIAVSVGSWLMYARLAREEHPATSPNRN